MSHQVSITDPLIRRLATLTCVVALVPISMGALVTTLDAGMAFADWPTSDGQNMFLYPWLRDFRSHPEKFVEHGHRLAGIVIGIISIGLTVAGIARGTAVEKRWVIGMLTGVILQGLLGGFRVLLDRQVMALVHSLTGGIFFAACVIFRLRCSPKMPDWLSIEEPEFGPFSLAVVLISPVLLLFQYVLGAALRHLHMMRVEHVVGAVLVSLALSLCSGVLVRAGHKLLKQIGVALVVCLCLQVLLGAGAYLTRFGLPQVAYVAVQGSVMQTVLCSLHTVAGMFLLSTQFVAVYAVWSLWKAGCLTGLQMKILIPERRPVA